MNNEVKSEKVMVRLGDGKLTLIIKKINPCKVIATVHIKDNNSTIINQSKLSLCFSKVKILLYKQVIIYLNYSEQNPIY